MMMEDSPYEFLVSSKEFRSFGKFYHRTFKGEDCIFFLELLQNIYSNHGGLEACFSPVDRTDIKDSITHFHRIFFSLPHLRRCEKHLPDPSKNSSCKRINMFLRWMVRSDNKGVDFGLWKKIRPSELMCPLDVHSSDVARKLGLLTRKQNDWKAVEELTVNLRKFDPADPAKYDFALFGLGIFEKF
jgi:uncharacterized protein (TIGR02757 family)